MTGGYRPGGKLNTHQASLLTPKMEGGATVPDEGLAITGLFIRLERDPSFREECKLWFLEASKA